MIINKVKFLDYVIFQNIKKTSSLILAIEHLSISLPQYIQQIIRMREIIQNPVVPSGGLAGRGAVPVTDILQINFFDHLSYHASC